MPLILGRIENSQVNGPGKRAVLHFQGCDLACRGCWNTNSHAFDTAKATDLEEIKKWINERNDVEGITFSGGEPMQQAQYLYLLLDFIKRNKPDWSVLMFTGYTPQELEAGKFKWRQESDGAWIEGSGLFWQEIKSKIDILVAGRYNEDKRTSELPLRGSSNQEVIFLTSRYSEKDLEPQEFEFNIAEDGLVKITGFPIGVDIDHIQDSKQEIPPKVLEGGDEGILVGV